MTLPLACGGGHAFLRDVLGVPPLRSSLQFGGRSLLNSMPYEEIFPTNTNKQTEDNVVLGMVLLRGHPDCISYFFEGSGENKVGASKLRSPSYDKTPTRFPCIISRRLSGQIYPIPDESLCACSTLNVLLRVHP